MRKFKLIKTYPGSDHEGIVVSLRTPNGLYEGYQYNYSTKHVENNPEYWEEVIEKDYEILSYVAKDCDTVIVQVPKTVSIIDNIPKNYWKIHSVKRLSDGEVFTVGDKFEANIGCKDVIRTIQKINVEGDRITIYHENGDLTNRKGSGIFYTIKKVKSPIFLTHDGKDIFEGDTVWYVNKENLDLDHFRTHANVTFRSDINSYFLTKEEAEDYIKRNKVLFITEDGVGIKKGDMIHGVYKISHTISNTVVGFNNGVCDPFEAVFSTREAAKDYLVENKPALSIKEFWDITCMSTSNFNKNAYMKDLVKERLNLK